MRPWEHVSAAGGSPLDALGPRLGPLDRRAVLTRGIERSLGLVAVQLSGPISFVFKVNRQGKVTLVHEQPDDSQGFVDAMTESLLSYRFEPIESSNRPSQYGAIIIQPEEGAQ